MSCLTWDKLHTLHDFPTFSECRKVGKDSYQQFIVIEMYDTDLVMCHRFEIT